MKSPRVDAIESPVKLPRSFASQYGERSPCRYGWNITPFAPAGETAARRSIRSNTLPALTPASAFSASPKRSRNQRWQSAAAFVAETVYHMPGITCP